MNWDHWYRRRKQRYESLRSSRNLLWSLIPPPDLHQTPPNFMTLIGINQREGPATLNNVERERWTSSVTEQHSDGFELQSHTHIQTSVQYKFFFFLNTYYKLESDTITSRVCWTLTGDRWQFLKLLRPSHTSGVSQWGRVQCTQSVKRRDKTPIILLSRIQKLTVPG